MSKNISSAARFLQKEIDKLQKEVTTETLRESIAKENKENALKPIETLKVLKAEAEQAILKILSELQSDTKCKVTCINITCIDINHDATTKESGPFRIMTNVSIILEIP